VGYFRLMINEPNFLVFSHIGLTVLQSMSTDVYLAIWSVAIYRNFARF
jgi:hypothetical protein